MKIIYTILLIIFAILIKQTQQSEFNLHLFDLEEYPEAQCLDGTPSGVYWQEGFGSGANKYIVFFEGGGACIGPTEGIIIISCYERSKTMFGSSTTWEQTAQGPGLMQDDPDKNPHYYNWNKFYIKYCNGLVHQGYRTEPYMYKDTPLYFKGLKSTEAAFDYVLNKLGMGNSTTEQVILTGSSAGGFATIYYADILAEQLHENTEFFAVADSGYFVNYAEDGNETKTLFGYVLNTFQDIVEVDSVRPQGCQYINDSENRYKCVDPHEVSKNIQSDLFIIQSQYDSYDVKTFLDIDCVETEVFSDCSEEDLTTLKNYRQHVLDSLTELSSAKQNVNFYSPACALHNYFSFNQYFNQDEQKLHPLIDNLQAQDAMYEWMNSTKENRKNYIDSVEWPQNQSCLFIPEQEKQNEFSTLLIPISNYLVLILILFVNM